ncbi:TRAP transporter small permease [Albimonas pacifica]|uniref:TRAP transporter small permease protein n=1 Tax=Albimonas pacifica TaxID=1114924 RepID=A0A1I3E8K5_9RHOB|nr:TRAP transporter small permease [Albimonas pacifica]SFH95322.1 TRAP-type mannitol/chloroaromatic compound transport system, small permease component [Albimonas pacifica]
MAGVGTAGTDPGATGGGGALGAVSGLLGKLEDGLNIFAAVTIFVLMIGTTISIASRIAGYPITGYLDISEQTIAIFAFLGAAYAQRLGAHIRMELIIGSLPGRLRWAIEALATFAGLCLVIVLIRYSWEFFLNAWQIGDSTVDIEFPTWPAKLLVPIAFSIWALRLGIETLGYLRLTVWPSAEPVAVPLQLTPAQEAEREIREAGIERDDDALVHERETAGREGRK